jgi:hypothetical protein
MYDNLYLSLLISINIININVLETYQSHDSGTAAARSAPGRAGQLAALICRRAP